MQHSAIGHVFSNALSAAFGYSPHVSASYGRNQGEHASRHESVSQGSSKGKSESFGVSHVYQRTCKLSSFQIIPLPSPTL